MSEGYKGIDDLIHDVIEGQYIEIEFFLGFLVLERNEVCDLRSYKSLSRVAVASYSTEYELKGHS